MLRSVLVAVAAALLPATPASAGTMTISSDPFDWVGKGQNHIMVNAQASVQRDGIDVNATDGADLFDITLAPPAGTTLAPGRYDHAQRTPFREAGRPGIELDQWTPAAGVGRGCNDADGSFEIRDLAMSGDTVTRLWAVFEQHCDWWVDATFGEIRIGEPAAPVPLVVRWPETDVGRPSRTVPVRISAAQPTTVKSVALAGANPSAFTIEANGCANAAISPTTTCDVKVAYPAATAGTPTAVLRVTDASGQVSEAALQAYASSGTTQVHLTSDKGDPVGYGEDRVYDPAHYGLRFYAANVAIFDFDDKAPSYPRGYRGFFAPTDGNGVLAPGSYSGATLPGSHPGTPWMDVESHYGETCDQSVAGGFTVNELRDRADGALHAFELTFDQRCNGGSANLHGVAMLHAGDTVAPPPWVVTGTDPVAPVSALPIAAPSPSPSPTADPTASPSPSPDPTVTVTATAAPTEAPSPGVAAPPPPSPVTATGDTPAPDPAAARAGDSPPAPAPPSVRTLPPDTCAATSVRRVVGTRGRDFLQGGRSADQLFGGAGPDRLDGRGGADCLRGGAGPDLIRGGRGADEIDGGPGRDSIDCGPGVDTVYLTPGDRTRGCERRLYTRPA